MSDAVNHVEKFAAGGKRKRPVDRGKDDLTSIIAGKLHHDMKDVRKAAKKAKAFEIQRLVKKLKLIRKRDATSEQRGGLEEQLECLKALDHDLAANTAAKTKLKKDRLLSLNDTVAAALPGELSNILPSVKPDTPRAKVESRVLSSKFLAIEISSMLKHLKTILDPAQASSAGPDGLQITAISPADQKEEVRLTKKRKTQKAEVNSEPDSDSEAHRNSNVTAGDYDEPGWESGTVDDEDTSASGIDASVANPIIHRRPPSPSSASTSDSEEPAVRRTTLASSAKSSEAGPEHEKRQLHAPAPKSASTFLPSLSVGFTRGDSSGSEWTDNEAKAADVEQKKNRRGQRARRAIWEKKFGRNANHVKGKGKGPLPGTELRAFPAGPDARRTRRREDSRVPQSQPQSQAHQKADSGWGQRVTKPRYRDKVTPLHRPAEQERPLHPSWEAKRQQKERQIVAIVPPQGKKITFS